jgi:hypothetical protein
MWRNRDGLPIRNVQTIKVPDFIHDTGSKKKIAAANVSRLVLGLIKSATPSFQLSAATVAKQVNKLEQ